MTDTHASHASVSQGCLHRFEAFHGLECISCACVCFFLASSKKSLAWRRRKRGFPKARECTICSSGTRGVFLNFPNFEARSQLPSIRNMPNGERHSRPEMKWPSCHRSVAASNRRPSAIFFSLCAKQFSRASFLRI